MVHPALKDSEAFATTLRALEDYADRLKHESTGVEAAYWQGRADALRAVITLIPEWLWLNDEHATAVGEDRARRLLTWLETLYGLQPTKDLLQEVHDLQALIWGYDERAGRTDRAELARRVRELFAPKEGSQ